jgi:apolipoprotein N-acyltransferase
MKAGLLTMTAYLGLAAAAFEGAILVLPWAFLLALTLAAPSAWWPGALLSLLGRAMTARAAPWSLPFSWTAAEFLAGRRWLWGEAASPVALGYTQLDSPLLPLAGAVGVTGVSLAVLVMNVSVAQLLLTRRLWPLSPALLMGSLAALPLDGSGVDRQSDSLVKVVVVQPALDSAWYEASAHSVEARERVLARLVGLSGRMADADLVVWPEGAVPSGLPVDTLPLRLRDSALDGAPIIAGAISERRGQRFNSAFLVTGKSVSRLFDKLALVPIGESALTPGRSLVVAQAAGFLLVGPLICLDSVYPTFARRLASQGAELLVVMSDDSFAGRMATPALHLRASIFRAVETGLPLVFASAHGPSAVVSGRGEVLARTDFGEPASLVSVMPRAGGPTPYVRLGEIVGQACVVLTLVLLAAVRLRLVLIRLRLRRL